MSKKRFSLGVLLLAALAARAGAHEIWLERDGDGPARVYFGEPGEPVRAEDIQSLKAPRVFGADPARPLPLQRESDHLRATPAGAGDVRLVADDVWKPRPDRQGRMQAVIFNARAGRADTRAQLDFELVPVSAGGNTFTVLFRGAPLAAKKVSVTSPDAWQKTLVSDRDGRVELPLREPGRYILASQHEVEAAAEVDGVRVERLAYVTTLSFSAP